MNYGKNWRIDMIKLTAKSCIKFNVKSMNCKKRTLDTTAYYTRMKKLWEELSTLHIKTQCNCNCTCGAKDNMFKVEQDRRLIQFLMGLNEVYTVVRGNIEPITVPSRNFFSVSTG